MEDTSPEKNAALKLVHKFENWVLVAATTAIVFFSTLQIVLRNFFESGVVWISPMLGILVLWVGLLGAILATRQHAHIKINVISNYLPEQYKPVAAIIADLFSAIVLFVLGYYCIEFVKLDLDTDAMAFASVPMWVVQIILPVSFFIMATRFLVYTFISITGMVRRSG